MSRRGTHELLKREPRSPSPSRKARIRPRVGALNQAAAPGHGHAALAGVAPPGEDGEIAGAEIDLAAVDFPGTTDRTQFMADCAGGDRVYGRLDIQ